MRIFGKGGEIWAEGSRKKRVMSKITLMEYENMRKKLAVTADVGLS